MPSNTHEALVELIRQQPGFAAQLLTDIADTVVTLHAAGGEPVLGVIAEVQLRADASKRYSWPSYLVSYLVSLRNRLHCPVILLVICTSDRVARWAAQTIDIGGGSSITPIVVGPAVIPEITDAAVARADPELAMLSAITHTDNYAVLDALFATFTPEIDRSLLYADLIRTVLPEAARTYLEHLMTTSTWRYQSEFARKYFDQGLTEGKTEGKADDILAVLVARGILVPDDIRARVAGCTDTTQLDAWLVSAATATTLTDVFD